MTTCGTFEPRSGDTARPFFWLLLATAAEADRGASTVNLGSELGEGRVATPGVQTRVVDFVRWFDGALPGELCTRLIEGFESQPELLTRHGRGHEAGLEHSGWAELEISSRADAAFKGYFITQVEKYLGVYNAGLRLTLPIPDYRFQQPLRIKRYRANTDDGFQPHFDALGSVSHRYLVFLWYLNDVATGGETEFCDLGIKVSARTGRLLMFPPYWMYQHAGLPPVSNDKYILSTYLLFPPDAGANSPVHALSGQRS